MADSKISNLTTLAAVPATGDYVPIVDVSDLTDAATGTTKKITVANLFTTPTIGSFVNAGHNHENAAGGGQIDSDALSGTIPITKGGTGQTANTAAFDALAPTTTAGDIIYHNGSDNIRLAKGTAGQNFVMNAGATAPEWGGAGTQHLVGTSENNLVKTYFNIQLPFAIATVSDLGWLKTATVVDIRAGGATASFISTGDAYLSVYSPFCTKDGTEYIFTDANTVIVDWFASYVSGTGEAKMGWTNSESYLTTLWDETSYFAGFHIANGVLYALVQDSTLETRTDISAGITLTNFNNFRIEMKPSTETMRLYVNGVLVYTIVAGNFPVTSVTIFGFGRDTTNPVLFNVTAPCFSFELNPS